MVLEGRGAEEEDVAEGSDGEAERPAAGLVERLRSALGDGEGADLLIQEDGVLRWLEALDLQMMGACRADERLKPLLKLNFSAGVAEDRLLSQLNQHFEVAEALMLMRCLCVPLVSIRAGKIIKQGSILSPTPFSGHLNLTLLPSSDLCISFVGDDGCTERLASLNKNDETVAAHVENISADVSGRSFLVKLPKGQIFYFWSAERLKTRGSELLMKMNDVLKTRPTLSQLTGISELRLECFASHLRANVLVSGSVFQSDLNSQLQSESGSSETVSKFSSTAHVPPLIQFSDSHEPKSIDTETSFLHSDQASSDKSPFGQGTCLPLNNHDWLSVGDKLSHPSLHSAQSSSLLNDECGQFQGHKLCSLPAMSLGEISYASGLPSLNSLPLSLPSVQSSILSSSFSHYCWCPPCTSSMQFAVATPNFSMALSDSLPLPPLSSLLSASSSGSSTAVAAKSTIDLGANSALDFSAIIPEPFVQRPLPGSSFLTVSTSQQLPSFTPFIADPIVHIPVIDVCSAGQGYLVSAGTALSSTVPPLVSNLYNSPLASDTAEKGARETLRLLINSSQSASLVDMLPAVFTPMDDSPLLPTTKPSALLSGSRGLYNSFRDIVANANGPSPVGVALLRGRGRGSDKKQDDRGHFLQSDELNHEDAENDGPLDQ